MTNIKDKSETTLEQLIYSFLAVVAVLVLGLQFSVLLSSPLWGFSIAIGFAASLTGFLHWLTK